MISKRIWRKDLGRLGIRMVTREGWFLFGFIPLYVRDLTERP